VNSVTDGILRWLARVYNGIRGYGFYWVETPGSPAGKYLAIKPGTCPYPLRLDWSAKACIKAGDCGCDEGCRATGQAGK
jgi:hypothetical protein